MTKLSALHQNWLQDPDYQATHDTMEEEFSIAVLVIQARARAGFSQAELAKRIETT
ncbi:hypothetical protein U5801_18350 [Lamprobacter modestohalophilus]|uniref:hypothetical protein n=1 Tax=Lamprobacter modestohalophilus TaxID=1064514 RepID=UPI002ADEE1F5|nr:hypothetical protein [Lamprobacter modestohalophilus]MEA1051749.1 hypothetical protein [Lamprobacter modestohalophilus]